LEEEQPGRAKALWKRLGKSKKSEREKRRTQNLEVRIDRARRAPIHVTMKTAEITGAYNNNGLI